MGHYSTANPTINVCHDVMMKNDKSIWNIIGREVYHGNIPNYELYDEV